MTILDRLFALPQRRAPTLAGPTLPSGMTVKATTGGAYLTALQSGPLLTSVMGTDPQQRAAAFLRAYKTGWFYKAESKISGDLARQPWEVTDGDIDSDDPEESKLGEPDLDIPFEALSPIDQFMRLMEKPNPNQTGRVLRQKTHIRRDMAGWAFWYLENGAGGGLPTAIYGISPSRLWPARDRQTQKLIGWILDYDQNGGTMTFEPDEIVTFSNATYEDDDTYGIGVVEAVYAELPLTDLMSRHTADLLTTGGRLAGMMWPRERALDEDELNDALRAWRNVTSDANAARRLLVFPEPMEYATGASTPAEIGIPELAGLNRDNILTAFPIAPEILGAPMPSGLNASGETRRELYDWYWEGTILPRSAAFDEVIQVNILSRYEAAMGGTFKYETQLPDLDDASSLLEKAGAFKSLTALGFDPKSTIKAVGLDHIKWTKPPEPVAPPPQPGQPGETGTGLSATVNDTSRQDNTQVSQQVVQKAIKARDDVVDANDPAIRDFLAGQRKRTTAAVVDTFPRTKAQRSGWAVKQEDWWDEESENALLTDTLQPLYVQSARGSLQIVADELDGIIPNRAVQRIVADLNTYAADRIVGINDVTRDAVKEALEEGTRRGYSLTQLIDGVPDEGFKGIGELAEWDDARAERIARTETMLSYNRSALDAYGEFGVREVMAHDGDRDAACSNRDGRTFSVEEALTVEDHPNGTLDWSPVTDKSYHPPAAQPVTSPPDWAALVEAMKASRTVINADTVSLPTTFDTAPLVEVVERVETAIREQPVPQVTVKPADAVFIERKAQNVQDVRIVADTTPPKTKRVIRGNPTRTHPDGLIQGVEDIK